jgi:hypothetical protein
MTLNEKADQLFGDSPRPEHFTDYRHCCECAEHDETFRAHTPASIGLSELGSPAWDPVCFATDEAFRYFFPALVRLAVQGTGETYYLDQFLFHLIRDGRRNSRWKAFSPEQRRFVVELLETLLEEKAAEIEKNLDADSILNAIEIWSETDD